MTSDSGDALEISDHPIAQSQNGDTEYSEAKKKKQYKQLQLPTQEQVAPCCLDHLLLTRGAVQSGTVPNVKALCRGQIAQEDFMNNCAVRTVLSGILGMGLGVAFGVFMGTMDTAVCPS